MRAAETRSHGINEFGEQNTRKHSLTFGPRGPEQRAMQDFQQKYGFLAFLNELSSFVNKRNSRLVV